MAGLFFSEVRRVSLTAELRTRLRDSLTTRSALGSIDKALDLVAREMLPAPDLRIPGGVLDQSLRKLS
jgi:hypothetical protein